MWLSGKFRLKRFGIMSKTVLIIGGGTGGHISPGVAIYEKAMEMNNLNPVFLTGRRDLRFSSLKDIESTRLFVYNPPTMTKNPFKLPFFVLNFFRAVHAARRIIRRNSVAAVVGMGGYVSAPALMAAKMKKIPIFLCEQNTVPGKVTVRFEKFSEKIYGTFPETRNYLKPESVYECVGNPIRHSVSAKTGKTESKKAFHMEHCDRVILVIGGSQGALKLNELMFDLKKNYPEEFKGIGVIWSTGESTYDRFKEKCQNELEAGSIYLSPFLQNVGKAYSACDLAISRSGAGVMMELASGGIPSVLIPYPFAALDHQSKNADSFVNAGAAVKISDADATAAKAGPVIFDLLRNAKKLKEMSARARSVARTDAADVIVNQIDQFFKK